MASESSSQHHHRWRHRSEKHLAPAKLDLPVFKSMDLGTDITYTIWRFDIESWLQHDASHLCQLKGSPQKMGALAQRWGESHGVPTAAVDRQSFW